MKIGIVTGEASGDLLGAGLIRSLKKYYPDASFVGIGGDRMLTEGFQSLFPMERLAVMGLVEPLKRLPELLSIRRQLIQYFIKKRFDIVIGIDAPDFNLSLEEKVKSAGIKTVHYVSPSVWAWRSARIKKIARAVNLMLTLLPFETNIYSLNKIPVKFIGHPLADEFPLQPDTLQAKTILKTLIGGGYDMSRPTLACLPGSRAGEVLKMGELFIEVAKRCRQAIPNLQMIIPAANQARYEQIQQLLSDQYTGSNVTVLNGHSHQVMAAADVVLMASGTSTLEAMLLKKPMVVVYKMAAISHWIISRLLKVPYISLPNLLADDALVPELIQEQATPEQVTATVLEQLQSSPDHHQQLLETFTRLHQEIRCDANTSAAKAIHELLSQ